jgi:hypothetical protein
MNIVLIAKDEEKVEVAARDIGKTYNVDILQISCSLEDIPEI